MNSNEPFRFSKRFAPLPPHKCFFYYDPPGVSYRGVVAVLTMGGSDVQAKEVFVGVSLCSPLDPFIKKVGRQMALGRAIQAYVRGDAYQVPLAIGDDPLDQLHWMKRLAFAALDADREEMIRVKEKLGKLSQVDWDPSWSPQSYREFLGIPK